MTSKFLSGGGGDLTNGSASLYIASLTVSGLNSSLPVKTNTVNTLVSEKLDIIDVENLQTELNSKIANPLTSDLDFQTFNATDVNSMELNKIATPSNATAGTLKLYANVANDEIHMIDENGADSVIGGNTFNQDLNTTDNVIFNDVTVSNVINQGDYTIGENSGILEIKQNGNKRLNIRDSYVERFHFINGFGPNTAYHYGRGTEANPSAVLSGDIINNTYEYGYYNASSENIVSQVRTRATENFNTNNLGVEMTFDTTNNAGGPTRTRKLKLDSSGTTIGDGTNSILLPTSRGTPGSVLVSDGLGTTTFDNTVLPNQDLNTTDNVIFNDVTVSNVINQGDYTIGENTGVLEIKQNGNKRLNIQGSFVERFHYTNGFGPNTSYHYGRGTEANPTAIISGDVINNQWEYGQYNTLSENIVSQVRTRATENFNTNNLGVEMTFDTTNNAGGPTRTRKLKLDSSGVTLNDAYTMPLTDGNAGSMLTTDGGGQTSWVPTTGIFAQTGDSTITATTVETSIIATGVGSLTVPANGFIVGNSFVAKVGGSLVASNGNTIQIRVKSGLVILADFIVPMDASTSAFELELDFTIAVVGIAGVAVIKSNGNFVYQSSGGGGAYQGANYNSSNITTFDTTISNTLDITVQHSNVAQVFNNNMCVLTRTYP